MSTGGAPTADGPGRLHVSADLRLVVGEAQATIVGDGSRLTMSTKDAPALLAEVVGANPAGGLFSLRRTSALVGRQLFDHGLSFEIVSNRGPLLELGGESRSRVAALLLGTEHARFGGLPALAATAIGYLRTPTPAHDRLRHAAAGLAVAGVVALIGVRRRSP